MQLIDAHTHLYFPDFQEDLDAVIERAREAGIRYFINAGTNIENSNKAIQLAERFDGFYAAVGMHPHEAEKIKEEDYAVFAYA